MVPLCRGDSFKGHTVQALYDGERVSGVPVVDRVLERGRRSHHAELLIAAAHRRVYVVGDGPGRLVVYALYAALLSLARTR